MAKVKREVLFIFIIGIILFSLLFVSAGFIDWFSGLIDITGFAETSTTTVSIALLNSAPNVSEVSSNVNASFDPTDSSITYVTFSVIVNDTNGDADIGNVTANFTSVSDNTIVRSNNTMCVPEETGTDSASVNFTCTIEMYFFDLNGDWSISVEANDSQGAGDVNNTVGLFYSVLTAMTMTPTALTLASANPGNTNITNSTASDFLNITNTGNREGLNISINSSDLGTTNAGASATDFIPVANFTFANLTEINATEVAECMDSTIVDPVNQTTNLVNITSTQLNGIVDRGNININQTSPLYLCLRHVPAGIGPYTYDTTRGGSWEIIIAPEP